jgi:hypothetical protein
MTHRIHRRPSSDCNVKHQTDISVRDQLPVDHGLPIRPFARQSPSRAHQLLIVTEYTDKNGTDDQGRQNVRRLPGVCCASPSQSQNQESESEQEEQLAAGIDRDDPRRVTLAPADLFCSICDWQWLRS